MDADAAMVFLTALTVGVSILAVAVALASKRSADDAVKQAQTANDLAGHANRLSAESNGIAQQAAEDARAAPVDVAWDELIAAVGAVQNLDVASSEEPVRPLLTAMRVRATLLIDRVAEEGFDEWVAREMRLGNLLMLEAATKGNQSHPLTPDSIFQINAPFHTWVAGFTSNLRRFRGEWPPDAKALQVLTEKARQLTSSAASRTGLPEPSDSIPGLQPLHLDGEDC